MKTTTWFGLIDAVCAGVTEPVPCVED